MGRRLREPNELLRTRGVKQIGTWASHHRQLVKHMTRASEIAQQAAARDQDRRARFYNHRGRRNAKFEVGDLVWMLKPPRDKGVTKLAHQWVGPARVLEDAGFDNLRIVRLANQAEMVAHCSFLTSYHCPEGQLEEIARHTIEELEENEADDAPDVWGQEPVTGEEAGTLVAGAMSTEDARAGAERPRMELTPRPGQ